MYYLFDVTFFNILLVTISVFWFGSFVLLLMGIFSGEFCFSEVSWFIAFLFWFLFVGIMPLYWLTYDVKNYCENDLKWKFVYWLSTEQKDKSHSYCFYLKNWNVVNLIDSSIGEILKKKYDKKDIENYSNYLIEKNKRILKEKEKYKKILNNNK